MAIVVWFTGLSGSGKSTLSLAIEQILKSKRIPAVVLDGDVVRQTLSCDLGFSPQDRAESLRRISALAAELCAAGKIVLVAAISPYRELRDEIRKAHLNFVEVFVNASLQCCERRDPKGLYRHARSGALREFTGISAPYETPNYPDVICYTEEESVEESSAKVLQAIEAALELRPIAGSARITAVR